MPSVEQWRPIASCPGYSASNRGRIRSEDRVVVFIRQGREVSRQFPGQILRYNITPDGYHRVSLGRFGHRRVHQLVAEAWIGPCPSGEEVRHGWSGPGDNSPENLCYGTRSQNMLDAVAHGTHHWSRRTHCPYDHRLALPNLKRSALPNRHCRACDCAYSYQYRRRKRGLPLGDFRTYADQAYAKIMGHAGTNPPAFALHKI
jgi:hypothetical protein